MMTIDLTGGERRRELTDETNLRQRLYYYTTLNRAREYCILHTVYRTPMEQHKGDLSVLEGRYEHSRVYCMWRRANASGIVLEFQRNCQCSPLAVFPHMHIALAYMKI